MRLVKIRNKYFFKSNNPNGTHTYAVYYDKKTKKYHAIPLTHLYVKDDKRFSQIKKGKISIEKFKEFDVQSGVWNYYYSENVNGDKINLKDPDIVRVGTRYLPKKQSDRLKSFSKYDYKKRKTHK